MTERPCNISMVYISMSDSDTAAWHGVCVSMCVEACTGRRSL